MKSYTLYEMAAMIRLNLWAGGLVENIGRVGGSVLTREDTKDCGWKGISLSANTMIERCEISEDGTARIDLSVYDPYEGTYHLYVTHSQPSRGTIRLLESIMEAIQQRRKVWSHNIYKNNIFHLERKYEADYSSIRSGSIGRPRKSNFFGR